MKKASQITLLFAILLFSVISCDLNNKYIGEWNGISINQNDLKFVFEKDDRIYIYIDGENIIPKQEIDKHYTKYEIYDDNEPGLLKVMTIKKSNNVPANYFFFIFSFENKTTLKMENIDKIYESNSSYDLNQLKKTNFSESAFYMHKRP